MRKKLTLLAMAIAAVAALSAPSLASATTTEWTDNGATLGTNTSVHLEGTLHISSATLGTIHCTKKGTIAMDLIAGGHNATVKSYTNSSPGTDCHITGFLGSTCGAHSLTEIKLLRHMAGTGTLGTKQVALTEAEALFKFGPCLSLTLGGSFVLTLDSETAATKATISGELTASGGFGKVKLSGVLDFTAPESGTYGLKTF